MKPKPIPPEPGQESVWDYPRPARLEDTDKNLRVIFNNIILAQTQRAKRVLETSHPPTYYFPSEDIKLEYLTKTPRKTWCEWKGWCQYYDVCVDGKNAQYGAWIYFDPTPDFIPIKDYFGFYARLMDACYVDDQIVTPQPGEYYSGWITKEIVGPFKGEPGTMGW